MAQSITTDPRVELILYVQRVHTLASAGVETSLRPEHWRCRCGESFEGKGALQSGRRHVAIETVLALNVAEATS